MASYATERKKRILTEKLGENWREDYPGKSIDALYNMVVGDKRRNLFCKIDPEVKAMIDEMSDYYDVRMNELVEIVFREKYENFSDERDLFSENLASEFVGR